MPHKHSVPRRGRGRVAPNQRQHPVAALMRVLDVLLLAAVAPLGSLAAQPPQPAAISPAAVASDARIASTAVDSLVARALASNPSVKAATARLEAARHRVAPAGTLPDPTLMAGVQNLPLGREAGMSGPDPMTMRMVGVGQTIPYPGKLAIRRRVAEREADAARSSLDAVRRRLVRDVKDAYYELAFVDQALAIVGRNSDVLASFVKVTEARYAVGTAGQQDVLKARVEATRLAETAITLSERRRAVAARLNALLDRPTDTAVQRAEIPSAIARSAVPASADAIRFTSAALGARAASSPLPPLAELQDAAVRQNPELQEHEAMIAAQATRLDLAQREVLPDFDVSVQYGQRGAGRPDMVSAVVSVPLPVFRGRKQDQLVAEAGAQLAALHAEHEAKANELRADVARLVSELERSRAQLALYVKGLLPQAHAALTSAAASYQVGKVEFLTVLDDQATVFSYETEYFRALSDYARNLAELERIVGREIL